MAKKILGNNTRVCATCEFWGGQRKPKLGGFVEYEDKDDNCYQMDIQGIKKNPMYGCGCWKKWGVFK